MKRATFQELDLLITLYLRPWHALNTSAWNPRGGDYSSNAKVGAYNSVTFMHTR